MKNREKIPPPPKRPLVFMGGTCADSKWRDRLESTVSSNLQKYNREIFQ